MTFICTYCGEMVEQRHDTYTECYRCGEKRKPDTEQRKKDHDNLMEEWARIQKAFPPKLKMHKNHEDVHIKES